MADVYPANLRMVSAPEPPVIYNVHRFWRDSKVVEAQDKDGNVLYRHESFNASGNVMLRTRDAEWVVGEEGNAYEVVRPAMYDLPEQIIAVLVPGPNPDTVIRNEGC